MSSSSDDELWMRRALELAEQGSGHVSPNPLVGCIVVRDGVKLGEGAYLKFGEAHAEVNAVANAKANGHSLRGATVYVTLEPHSFVGKTPPCTDLLIREEIARCVIATEDPNPLVSGQGVAELRDANIEVSVGVLEAEAIELNRFFNKHIVQKLPYVTMKMAQSLDGRSALASGSSRWISSVASRTEVHRMRRVYDAVLIGRGAARADDPSLTVRLVQGRQPLRVVLDTELTLPRSLKLFTDEFSSRTILFTSKESIVSEPQHVAELRKQLVEVVGVDSDGEYLSLRDVLRILGERGIASVLIEPGPELASVVIREGLFDEIVCFVAPRLLGGDAKPSVGKIGIESLDTAPGLKLRSVHQVENSEDIKLVYRAID
jgi:diaminohydroxyphosphoribosylaminopyrimidine deaminase/5-amino-6-(5-phosphoribosylamino)uracil reductase